MNLLLVLLVILLVLAAFGGVWGYNQGHGYVSASPLVLIIVILIVLWAFGYLR